MKYRLVSNFNDSEDTVEFENPDSCLNLNKILKMYAHSTIPLPVHNFLRRVLDDLEISLYLEVDRSAYQIVLVSSERAIILKEVYDKSEIAKAFESVWSAEYSSQGSLNVREALEDPDFRLIIRKQTCWE